MMMGSIHDPASAPDRAAIERARVIALMHRLRSTHGTCRFVYSDEEAIAEITAAVAEARAAGVKQGRAEFIRDAENAVIETAMSDPSRRRLRQIIRALRPPAPETKEPK